jgi:hypothetical protein
MRPHKGLYMKVLTLELYGRERFVLLTTRWKSVPNSIRVPLSRRQDFFQLFFNLRRLLRPKSLLIAQFVSADIFLECIPRCREGKEGEGRGNEKMEIFDHSEKRSLFPAAIADRKLKRDAYFWSTRKLKLELWNWLLFLVAYLKHHKGAYLKSLGRKISDNPQK